MPKLPGAVCRHQTSDTPEPKLRPVALVQLIAIVTLALSTLIAATAVTIGLARAEFAPIGAEAAPFAVGQGNPVTEAHSQIAATRLR